MKRLIVYFHYDPLGQIETACRVAVEAMAHYGEVFFISNGHTAGGFDLAQRVIMEINDQPFHGA